MKKDTERTKGKKRRIVWIVVGVIALLLVLGVIMIPKLLFADYEGLPTTGEYEVEMESAILVDANRVESFETDGSKREVPVHFYYPDTEAVDESGFPLIIFSHGAFGYYQSNTSTYMELASHGYVVISLDHPYHSFFTEDTEGKTIIVNSDFLQEVMNANEESVSEQEIIETSHKWLDIRVADIDFVLDVVKAAKEAEEMQSGTWFVSDESTEQELLNVLSMTDTEKIGLMGHSLGGASSITLGRTRVDIDAVISLDATMLGEELGYENGEYKFYEEAYPVPLLALDNEEHHQQRETGGNLYVNNVVLENAVDGQYTYFVGSGHMNFTDLPLFSPFLASMLGVGDVDATECITTMNQIILDYYNYYLKDEGVFTIQESY